MCKKKKNHCQTCCSWVLKVQMAFFKSLFSKSSCSFLDCSISSVGGRSDSSNYSTDVTVQNEWRVFLHVNQPQLSEVVWLRAGHREVFGHFRVSLSYGTPFDLSSPDRPVDRESHRLCCDGHGRGQPEQRRHPVGPEHHLPLRVPHQVPAYATLHCAHLCRWLRLLKEHLPWGEPVLYRCL